METTKDFVRGFREDEADIHEARLDQGLNLRVIDDGGENPVTFENRRVTLNHMIGDNDGDGRC